MANKIIKSTGLVNLDISKAKLNNEKLTKRAYMLACPERFSNMCDMRYPDILIMILYQSGRVLASMAGGPGFNPKSRTASYQRRYKNGTSSSQDLTQDLPHSWFVKSMGFKKVLQPIKDQLATMVIMYFVYTVLYTFIGVFLLLLEFL